MGYIKAQSAHLSAQVVVIEFLILVLIGSHVPARVLAEESTTASNAAGASNTTDIPEVKALMKCFNEKYSPDPITVTMYLASTPSRRWALTTERLSSKNAKLPTDRRLTR